jgi:hypothetical protein
MGGAEFHGVVAAAVTWGLAVASVVLAGSRVAVVHDEVIELVGQVPDVMPGEVVFFDLAGEEFLDLGLEAVDEFPA